MAFVSPSAAPSASDQASQFSPRRRVLALITVALAFVLDLLDTTIVNVAIPSIKDGLGAAHSDIEWVIAGYAMAFAVLLVVGGRLGDSYGYRRLFLIGVGSFTLASLLCGLAPSPGFLIGARIHQGLSAALMAPQVMALMQVMYPPAERFKVYAVFGFLGGFSAGLGPIVGGILIEADWFGLAWRNTFLINLPVGLLSLIAGVFLLPQGRASQASPVDAKGALLSMLLLFAVLLPLIEGPQLGWPVPLRVLLAAVPLLIWGCWRYFILRQRARGDALVPPALLRERTVALGLACTLCLNPVISGYLLVMTVILQEGYKLTPLDMAYACLPIAIGAMLAITLIGPRLHALLGTRAVHCSIAASIASLVLARMALQSDGVDWVALLAGQLAMGVGIGLSGPPLSNVTLARVPVQYAGTAAGLLSATQQVAGALGVALVGIVLFGGAGANWPTALAEQGLRYQATLPVFAGFLLSGFLFSLALPRRAT